MLVIVDYGVGNLTSIQNMIRKGGNSCLISGDSEDVMKASKIILPGMGAFDNCMKKLDISGLKEIIVHKVMNEKVPVLGICVGLQMMMSSSEEGALPGLGWISGRTIGFIKSRMVNETKIPNMGWLEVRRKKPSPILENMEEPRFYFAHSYHVKLDNMEDEVLDSVYGYDFTAGIEHENIIGVQFHPEKSHRFGLQLLKNFSENY